VKRWLSVTIREVLLVVTLQCEAKRWWMTEIDFLIGDVRRGVPVRWLNLNYLYLANG